VCEREKGRECVTVYVSVCVSETRVYFCHWFVSEREQKRVCMTVCVCVCARDTAVYLWHTFTGALCVRERV